VHVPRIGQEVIIDFFGGDPDLPICTGRVHNQMNLPPWKLPGQAALSGFAARELVGKGATAPRALQPTCPGRHRRKIQAQLKSDHQCSSLSLGAITRIEDNAGRKDPRGQGFELRTDGHGVMRADGRHAHHHRGLHGRRGHAQQTWASPPRLRGARPASKASRDAARTSKAQTNDQAEVAKALKKQNDAIKGAAAMPARRPVSGAGGAPPGARQPEPASPTPRGVQHAHRQRRTHADHQRQAHQHQQRRQPDRGRAGGVQAVYAMQKGMEMIAAQADIEIKALKTCINLLAKDEITIRADKIRIEAKTELVISGGGSYAHYKGGSIESGTTGPHVQHASSHSMLGPSSSSRPSLPDGLKPGKGQLELTHRYANNHGLKGADYKVTDSAGQVKTGTLDDKGFAAVSGLAPGGARIELGEDPRNPWDPASYFGEPTWPPKKTDGAADVATARASDMLDGLMKQAIRGHHRGPRRRPARHGWRQRHWHAQR
jgi:type VI secretion system secreted protein VgrG